MRNLFNTTVRRFPSTVRRSVSAKPMTTLMRPFSDIVGSNMNPETFNFPDFSQNQKQPIIDLVNMRNRHGRRSQNVYNDQDRDDGDNGDPGDNRDDEESSEGSSVISKLPGNIDISSIMVRPSAYTLSKFAIKTIISAFLTILIGSAFETPVKSGVKKITTDVDRLTNEITESVYKYIIATASERLQKGDTTVIASIYFKIGQHLSIEKRKEMLEKLVINGVSYGWLAIYDGVIEQWLTKIKEIKGGELPSDKYLINIINIIQNKVIPVTNGIWYFKRAVKLRTGLGITDADSAPDEYWYTAEGQRVTASGTREILTEDTMLAKIIVGLLAANEAIDNTNMLIESAFSDINHMIRHLVIIFKTHLDHAKVYKTTNIGEDIKSKLGNDVDVDAGINMQIRELNKSIRKCETYLESSTTKTPFKDQMSAMRSKTRRPRATNTQYGNDIRKLQEQFGLFNPTLGGSRSRSRSRSRKVMRKTRRVRHRTRN